MLAGRFLLAGDAEAVRERLAVVGEDLADLERSLLDQAAQNALGGGGRLVGEDLHEDPAGRPVDGGKQVRALVLVRHLGQILQIHVDKARLVVLEALGLLSVGLLLAFPQRLEVGDAVSAQATAQAGTGDVEVVVQG